MHIQSKEVALNHKVTGNFDAPNPAANYAPNVPSMTLHFAPQNPKTKITK